ncbi:NADAR family protein [Streptomyces caniscabiei]|uniref:NADAR family protein n=1 Tax=Streptomyces caniscabiei TaxID=2746961 RepID=A0A927QPN7_9ACTN|nr:NADAR family protein [Streptomyces caniscabiei]MBD9704038.1 NADAR family protein [Streptomyces caniscabiei]MBD9729087.1 NADAR family protein [Streptomyces caniscabiei]MDX3514664.1 NADAR family protein [Streptomyces caniscabiei]MDX3723940.1 NADAR family protein [Streptomyces caniscabiei]MDX3731649.1 NADAR family protein [Streptomyces caniscabiei]
MEKIDSWDTLTEAVRAGARVKYLHFWGHRPLPDGRIGASCLSQWWPSPFTVDGVEYATAEHWMMAAKARLFGDPEAERKAVAASGPAQAKKVGRLVRGFDDAVWERERFGIVVEGSFHKFAAHADLRAFLLGTGGRVLVEASPLDRIWGIGLAADDERAMDPARWRGPNLLGFALMAAREHLSSGGAPLPAGGAVRG